MRSDPEDTTLQMTFDDHGDELKTKAATPRTIGTVIAGSPRFFGAVLILVMVSVQNVHRFYQAAPRENSNSNSRSRNVMKMTEEEEEEVDTYTLVVVHCKANITWLDEVPSDWRIVLYNKCNNKKVQKVIPNVTLTQHVPANAGEEECNGYLDFMYDYYHNLSTVTVFMHDDGLIPYDTKHEAKLYHTPFSTFEPIVNVTKQFLTPQHPFLHLGKLEIMEKWGKDPYWGLAQKILWPYFAVPVPNKDNNNTSTSMIPLEQQKMKLPRHPQKTSFKPSAHFAVHKQQIQKRPQSTYWAILQQSRFASQVKDSYPNARQFCCAMERTWHVFFGEPHLLPTRAIASDLLNMTKCQFCEG
ncbi:expressed unknown protein [Seminavis robusta]|uniref:Uncharacterized protein n=1 Tax=Seminavis robusta TaxID=568900 RepID=A0A9N8EER6_9STRA|nr:expressed unknown protein [Seminavis robusta]|eukprot:Sro1046_g235080.1 n/a (356) ;mRNA; r:26539-27606